MLITHWKTEGHKKNVLKKDKFDLMSNCMINNYLHAFNRFFMN